MTKLPKLLNHLNTLPPGPLQDKKELVSLLSACWDELAGSDDKKMTSNKLGRMENAMWDPPTLSFDVERHGAMKNGSKYAEVQRWKVDLGAKTATPCIDNKKRLKEPIEPPLDVKPLAAEIAALITGHKQDARLSWKDDGTVNVKIGAIIPDTNQRGISIAKQTVTGRRRRFREELELLLYAAGWTRVRANYYAPPNRKT